MPTAQGPDRDSVFRVALLTGLEPRLVARIVEQIEREVPEARVTGILYHQRAKLSTRQRIAALLRELRQPTYLRYVAARLAGDAAALARRGWIAAVRTFHAYTPPAIPAFDLDALAAFCDRRGAALHVAASLHAEAALQFVRDQSPDLGIVYGTPILKPVLFEIPRAGSINVHQRRVPDYRGGGPIGLWEMLDGQTEIGITIHRVATQLDAGAVIRTATIAIEPFDDLDSLGLKAHVVSMDLLALAVGDFVRGDVHAIPQSGPSRLFRTPKPAELRRHLATLAAKRPAFQPNLGWPSWKLLAKLVLFGPAAMMRNWRRRATGTFPVVVLYHHIITDRPHFMGLPTAQYVRQLEFLRTYYDVVDFDTAVARLRSGPVHAPTVVLTFDDGYQANALTLRAAALALEHPAMLFVCSDHIAEGRPFAHDVERGLCGFNPLTWDEVGQLEAYGFQFGSHTRTHFDCGSSDESALRDQIVGCQTELERHLGHPVPAFSFPFGLPPNISGKALQLARGSYKVICSAYGGENTATADAPDWHLFRRSHPDTLLELELSIQSLLEQQPPLWLGRGAATDSLAPRLARASGSSDE